MKWVQIKSSTKKAKSSNLSFGTWSWNPSSFLISPSWNVFCNSLRIQQEWSDLSKAIEVKVIHSSAYQLTNNAWALQPTTDEKDWQGMSAQTWSCPPIVFVLVFVFLAQVSVSAGLEHPFFVFGRGWASPSPQLSMARCSCHFLVIIVVIIGVIIVVICGVLLVLKRCLSGTVLRAANWHQGTCASRWRTPRGPPRPTQRPAGRTRGRWRRRRWETAGLMSPSCRLLLKEGQVGEWEEEEVEEEEEEEKSREGRWDIRETKEIWTHMWAKLLQQQAALWNQSKMVAMHMVFTLALIKVAMAMLAMLATTKKVVKILKH